MCILLQFQQVAKSIQTDIEVCLSFWPKRQKLTGREDMQEVLTKSILLYVPTTVFSAY